MANLRIKMTEGRVTYVFLKAPVTLDYRQCHLLYSLHWVLRLVPVTGFEVAKNKSGR